MAKALHNATTQSWVHEIADASSGSHYLKTDSHVGVAEGSETVSANGALANLLLVGGVGYIEGNETAIVHYFGFPTKNPKGLAGRWISIQPNDPGFTSVTGAVTLKDVFAPYSLGGHLKKGADKLIDGVEALPIEGTVHAQSGNLPATLYVTTTGTLLPIEISVKNGSLTSVVTWDQWGKVVALTAPRSTIPITTADKK